MVFSLSGNCWFNWFPGEGCACSLARSLKEVWANKELDTLCVLLAFIGLYTAVSVGTGYVLGTGRLGQREVLLRVPDTAFSFSSYGSQRIHAEPDWEARPKAVRPSF